MTEDKKDASKGSGTRDNGKSAEDVELDFGGLFRGLGEFVDLVGKLAEAGEKHVSRQGEFRIKGLDDRARGVYGFSIRTGLGGTNRSRVEPFGNVQASEEGLVVGDVREPLVDVFDESDEIVVTAELPGVSERDISVTFEDEALKIETFGERHYAKKMDLPSAVAPESLKQTYNNGVLELRIDKRK